LLFSILCKPEYKPWGGGSDGKMARKADEIWAPALKEFMKKLLSVNAVLPSKRGIRPRSVFTELEIERCFKKWGSKYKEVKASLHIVNHPRVGNSGAEAPGVVPDDVLGEAQAKFHLWSSFHAEFGLCARYRDDLAEESMSPLKPENRAILSAPQRAASQRRAAALGVRNAVRKAVAGGITPPLASRITIPTVSVAAAARSAGKAVATGSGVLGKQSTKSESVHITTPVPNTEIFWQNDLEDGAIQYNLVSLIFRIRAVLVCTTVVKAALNVLQVYLQLDSQRRSSLI
jgi:hypothetical protein